MHLILQKLKLVFIGVHNSRFLTYEVYWQLSGLQREGDREKGAVRWGGQNQSAGESVLLCRQPMFKIPVWAQMDYRPHASSVPTAWVTFTLHHWQIVKSQPQCPLQYIHNCGWALLWLKLWENRTTSICGKRCQFSKWITTWSLEMSRAPGMTKISVWPKPLDSTNKYILYTCGCWTETLKKKLLIKAHL